MFVCREFVCRQSTRVSQLFLWHSNSIYTCPRRQHSSLLDIWKLLISGPLFPPHFLHVRWAPLIGSLMRKKISWAAGYYFKVRHTLGGVYLRPHIDVDAPPHHITTTTASRYHTYRVRPSSPRVLALSSYHWPGPDNTWYWSTRTITLTSSRLSPVADFTGPPRGADIRSRRRFRRVRWVGCSTQVHKSTLLYLWHNSKRG